MSETDRMIDREHDRLALPADASLRLSRRALLKRTAALATAWTVCPWPIGVPPAYGQSMDRPSMIQTLEAFADTLIPGEKRYANDLAIAGAVSGPGAVQGGAIEMMTYPPVGLANSLPDVALVLNLRTVLYAVTHDVKLSLQVPPFVELDFASRTALLLEILDGNGPLHDAYYALASVVFLGYNTAAYLDTAEAIRDGHPGLKALGFPPPDADGVWRFPEFSYRRVLATPHPDSRNGQPA